MARILIVEDSPYSLELMSYLLGAYGHVVHAAQSGAQALRMVEHQHVDLVLLDLQLPDLDGYQVLRVLRAKERFAQTKIIAVTAVAMVGDRERTLAAGFDHYMPKPINPRSFVPEINGWLPTDGQPDTSATEPAPSSPGAGAGAASGEVSPWSGLAGRNVWRLSRPGTEP